MASLLIVDDEADVANAWARTLTLGGHKVSVAYDTSKALKLSREHPFDLAILDYMMPTMTGIELLNEIRKDHPLIRSIIISGRLDPTISESAILSDIKTNIEADEYIHKPIDNARLKETVAALLAAKDDGDWKSFASTKLDAPASKTRVRAAETLLRKKKKK